MAKTQQLQFLSINLGDTGHIDDIARELTDHMRAADKEEMNALGFNDEEYCRASIHLSFEAYEVRNNEDELVCILGVSEYCDKDGHGVWLLGTTLSEAYAREFIHFGRIRIQNFVARYGDLFNYVAVTNKKSLRWLRLMGATFDKPVMLGQNGEHFVKFHIRKGVERNV